jgi:hypothetical protein
MGPASPDRLGGLVQDRLKGYNSDMLMKHKPGSGKASRDGADHTAAEALAVEVLAFLAGDEARLAGFLDATGLTPQTLRAAASTPGFLVGVLDHLAADESLLLAFAAQHGADPAAVLRARQRLAGPLAEGLREG